MRNRYPCPGCRTTNNLHDPDCTFAGVDRETIEAAYLYVITKLVHTDSPTEHTFDDTDDYPGGVTKPLVLRTVFTLSDQYHVEETGDGSLRLLPADEYREEVSEPQTEPLRTIYEKGSVSGCHDNAVFAMIAFYEMVGFSWEESRELVLQWIEDTGTWERGGFSESSPEELVDSKKHVYESGYGWKDKARAAKSVIDRKLG